MNAKQFHDLVDRALEELPPRFRDPLQNIQVIVKSVPGTEAHDQPASHELLGLYVGNPLTEQSATEPPLFPAQIFIYRDNLIRQCGEDEQALVEEIRITVLHEVGHHLGLDDEEMEMLEDGEE